MPRNYVSRSSRIADYAAMKGPNGATCDEKNLQYWADRASSNSKIAPRASDGEMKLPSTKMKTRDTAMKPLVSRRADARMTAKDDVNHDPAGSPFLKGIRRTV